MRNEQDAVALSKWRYEKAAEELKLAKIALAEGLYNGAAGRAYYAIFHAMRAVLALEGFDSKKHSGIISKFRLDYIKPRLFGEEASIRLSSIAGSAFQTRQDSDYTDFYVLSKADVEEQVENAEYFLSEIQLWLTDRWDKAVR